MPAARASRAGPPDRDLAGIAGGQSSAFIRMIRERDHARIGGRWRRLLWHPGRYKFWRRLLWKPRRL